MPQENTLSLPNAHSALLVECQLLVAIYSARLPKCTITLTPAGGARADLMTLN